MDDVPNSSLIHRETRALVLLVLIAVVAFIATRAVAHANQSRRQRDAQAWLSSGQDSLRRGDAAMAARQLRRAASLDPSSGAVRLALAAALRAADVTGEARRILLEARAAAPESADVNLALGRLEATHGDIGATISAYHAALDNLWRPAEARSRYQVRVELVRYLLARDQRSRALSELLIVSAEMPDTAAALTEVGSLFLEASEPGRALTQLERARALDSRNQAVALAAGRAAFALGQDGLAVRHLRAAPDLAPARDLASTIALALSNDPLLPRLSAAQRERRLRGGLRQARVRLAQCTPVVTADGRADPLPLTEQLNAFEASLAPGRHRPPVVDQLDDGVELIARIESQTASCIPQATLDQALILIGRRHAGPS
jgi:predicted Zn-dependent protease